MLWFYPKSLIFKFLWRMSAMGGARPDVVLWSMDFAFDRTAEGRVMKNLTIVNDALHEAVAIVPERAIGGLVLTRILPPRR